MLNNKIKIDGATDEQIGYHVYLMHQAGLVDAVDSTFISGNSPNFIPRKLTWDGHDFLDSIKDESLWEKAKKSVITPAGGVAFSVLLEWVKAEAKSRIGLT